MCTHDTKANELHLQNEDFVPLRVERFVFRVCLQSSVDQLQDTERVTLTSQVSWLQSICLENCTTSNWSSYHLRTSFKKSICWLQSICLENCTILNWSSHHFRTIFKKLICFKAECILLKCKSVHMYYIRFLYILMTDMLHNVSPLQSTKSSFEGTIIYSILFMIIYSHNTAGKWWPHKSLIHVYWVSFWAEVTEESQMHTNWKRLKGTLI